MNLHMTFCLLADHCNILFQYYFYMNNRNPCLYISDIAKYFVDIAAKIK